MKTIGDLPEELAEFIGKHVVIKAAEIENILHEAKGHWKDGFKGGEWVIDVPLYFTYDRHPKTFSGILRGTHIEEFRRSQMYILIDPDDKELLKSVATKINPNPKEIRIPVNHSLIEIDEIQIELNEGETKTIGINRISF